MHRRKKVEVKVTLDFETYYDSDYSLRKLSTINYLRDPRFEVHMASWRSRDLGVVHPVRVAGDEQVRAFVAKLQQIQQLGVGIRLVGHNLAFDALLLREKYGFETPYYFDTSLLPVLKYGNTLKDLKLETLADKLNLTVDPALKDEARVALGLSEWDMDSKKLSAVLNQVKGKRWDEIPEGLRQGYMAYCDVDVLLTDGVHDDVAPWITDHALYIQDMHLHALVTMPLRVDTALLHSMRDDYVDARDAEIQAFAESCGVPFDGMKSIRSKDKFAKLLTDMGVPEAALPRKPNPKGEQIYAFAANDLALDVLPDQFPTIDLLGEAVRLRLNYNSTAVESKLKRFAAAGASSAKGDWAFHVKPFGARNTARHSGSSATGASPQNMGRAKPTVEVNGAPHRNASDVTVRDAIMAREGKELCVADLSGIELRTCMWWCNDHEAIEILSDPTRDMYTEDGRIYFDKPDMTKKDKNLRQAAKVADLSAQYGVGWKKILHQAKLWRIPMTVDQAQTLHAMYRVRHPAVVERWAELQKYMRDLAQGFKFEYELYPCNMTDRGIELPNGFLLRYPSIQYSYHTRQTTYWNAAKRSRINVHAGAMVENCSQALAAAVFNDVLERTYERLHQQFEGVQFVGDVHDEMLFSCNAGDGAQVLAVMLEEMARPVPWWEGLVTLGEGDHGFATMERPDGTIDRASRYGCLK